MGAIVPFRRTGSVFPDLGKRREELPLHPADPLQQSEALRDARRKLAECWELRAESERIRRGYEERQRAIERLLAGLPSDVERA